MCQLVSVREDVAAAIARTRESLDVIERHAVEDAPSTVADWVTLADFARNVELAATMLHDVTVRGMAVAATQPGV